MATRLLFEVKEFSRTLSKNKPFRAILWPRSPVHSSPTLQKQQNNP